MNMAERCTQWGSDSSKIFFPQTSFHQSLLTVILPETFRYSLCGYLGKRTIAARLKSLSHK
jgi:hypothetical protein